MAEKYKIIDLEQWNRKDHYTYFSKYDNPFFGIVTEIDCTNAYQTVKQKNESFFAFYLHKSIVAANHIEELKYRILEEKPVIYDVIHPSTTIARTDGTFGFAMISFIEDFKTFSEALQHEIKRVQTSKGLCIDENTYRKDVIHYSTFPWRKFTGLTHARSFNTDDSIPKITFGKIYTNQERLLMPVSIDAHHSLLDGFHVAKYLDEFEQLLNK